MTDIKSMITHNDQDYLVNLHKSRGKDDFRVSNIATILFAHGAGAPMDSDYMNTMSNLLVREDIRVVRFEFPYMQQRRVDGKKRPPNREPACLDSWSQAIADWKDVGPIYIAGKSMGGRMASILAAKENLNTAFIQGVICFGYPFHAPGKTDKWRTDHFATLTTPTYIFQGERDPFGKREEIEALKQENSSWPNLNNNTQISLHWVPDGDHDFKPRVKSVLTQLDNLNMVSDSVAKIVAKN